MVSRMPSNARPALAAMTGRSPLTTWSRKRRTTATLRLSPLMPLPAPATTAVPPVRSPGPAGVWSFMNAAPSGRQAELHQAVDQAAAEHEGAAGRGTHARGGGPVIRAAVQVNADDRGKAALPGVPEPEQGQGRQMRARGGAREQQPAGAETVTDARRGPARGCHAIVELTGDGRLGNQPVIRADGSR